MPAGPADSPGFLLWHATLRWQRDIAAVLNPLELTHVQFVLLASLWWLDSQGKLPNQLELARHAGTDVKMSSQVLGRLEEKGLLEREVDAQDSRAKRLRITEKGKRKAAAAIEVVEEVDRRFFEPVDDRKALLGILKRLAG
ncbi:MAG TPA: MarR family transcriptional regulator [Micromonosporaceae bacterium]|nr:MarR family transcriptional regulator [Micromonosporaceae bacterium]HCU51387.1 MarR family transcriptional regulator [Micromonosporaceae bacterium]